MIKKIIDNKIFKLTFFLFFIFILTNNVFADLIPSTSPCMIKGTVTGSGITVTGLTVQAYDGSTLLTTRYPGTIASDGTYTLDSVGSYTGKSIDLRVYGATFETYSPFVAFCTDVNGNPWVTENFTVSLQADGVSCSNNAICTSGLCSSGVCTTESTGGGSPGSGSGSGSGSGTPSVTTQTFTSTTTPSASEISGLLAGSGLSTDEIQAYIDAANAGQLDITTTLNVVTTGNGSSATYKSTFTISITNNTGSNLTNIKIVEVIPKNIVTNASQITSLAQFRVLVADPVLEFSIASLNAGSSTSVSYSINDNVTQAEFLEMQGATGKGTVVAVTTPGTGEVTETIPGTGEPTSEAASDTGETPAMPWAWIIIAIVILIVVVILILSKNKNPRRDTL